MSAHAEVCKGSCLSVTQRWRGGVPEDVVEPEIVVLFSSTASGTLAGQGAGETAFNRIAQEQSHAATSQWFWRRHIEGALSAQKARIAEIKQRAKNQAAIDLLEGWLQDESGYDEEVWPGIKKAIEENRMSDRSRFSD